MHFYQCVYHRVIIMGRDGLTSASHKYIQAAERQHSFEILDRCNLGEFAPDILRGLRVDPEVKRKRIKVVIFYAHGNLVCRVGTRRYLFPSC